MGLAAQHAAAVPAAALPALMAIPVQNLVAAMVATVWQRQPSGSSAAAAVGSSSEAGSGPAAAKGEPKTPARRAATRKAA